MEHKFNYNWTLKDANFSKDKGVVFSCFACGGGQQWLSVSDICKVSSFPQDYDFGTQKPEYICGMSVPPIMIAQIATQVYEQWLTKLTK